jgi:hypothetical protein
MHHIQESTDYEGCLLFLVIEVSCGEYGDNIGKLVRAIQNGKHDIREGKPFPELPPAEVLNNASVKLSNGNGVLGASEGDSEDGDGVKYSNNGATNVNLYQPFVTKETAKEEQSKCEVFMKLYSVFFKGRTIVTTVIGFT